MANIDHPQEAPVWLEQWFSTPEINERFSQPVRSFAMNLISNISQIYVQWGKFTYTVTLGTHHVTWRIQDGNRSFQCDCKAAPQFCTHAYAAHLLLQNICRKQGWHFPERTAAPHIPTVPARPTPPLFAQSRPAPRPEFSHQEPFLHPAPRSVEPARLICVVSFPPGVSWVSINFLLEQKGYRSMQTLGWVRNNGFDIKRNHPQYIWNQEDTDFLLWLNPQLQKQTLQQLTGQVFHLNKEQFQVWIKHWKGQPQRFLEHDSNEPVIPPNIQTPVGFYIHLSDRGESIRVCACFRLPENGKYLHVHQALDAMKKDRSAFLVKNILERYQPPIPWETLIKRFGNGPVWLKRNEVCARLPQLLDHHIDLIEDGPCVKHLTIKTKLSLSLQTEGNGDFTISLRKANGGTPVFSDKHLCTLKQENWKFVIETVDDEQNKPVLEQLSRLQQSTNAVCSDGKIRVAGTPENAGQIRRFCEGLPSQQELHVSNDVKGILSPKTQIKLAPHLQEIGNFYNFDARFQVGDETLSFAELQQMSRNQSPYFRRSNGEWFCIDQDSAARAVSLLLEEGLDGRPTILLPTEANRIADHFRDDPSVKWPDRSISILEHMQNAQRSPYQDIPQHLSTILRPYQVAGVNFLCERSQYGIGSILADEMGLGKTLQVLTLLERFAQCNPNFRALIVCPASVVDTWLSQAKQFCPELTIEAFHGNASRRAEQLQTSRAKVLVTHYGLVRMDAELWQAMDFQFIILDEAQNIKNPHAMVTKAVRSLHADCRIALTGTPLENSLRDLWSILDFINPNLVGDADDFAAHALADNAQHIKRVLSLIMLRRTKELVAPELPDKFEETILLDMPEEMEEVYQRELARAKRESKDFTSIFAALTRLRRLCCAPELVLNTNGNPFPSPKLDFLLERLEELTAGGHSVLVFSQFTTLLDLLRPRLEQAHIHSLTLTGDTPVDKRPEIVRTFQESNEPTVFLLSLKAAGTGLTLTRADYVFLFDPWWNPAVENQAIDRTHRIGQDKPVFAYRIILKNTVEEKVLNIIQQKRELFATVIAQTGDDDKDFQFSLEEMRGLLS
ncbi:MAG: DEAD/DEAH box helicase family protein [Victivallales bacterium]|nr:DEAD/DEAH box helicase family protein [Victivallales bacterium]